MLFDFQPQMDQAFYQGALQAIHIPSSTAATSSTLRSVGSPSTWSVNLQKATDRKWISEAKNRTKGYIGLQL